MSDETTVHYMAKEVAEMHNRHESTVLRILNDPAEKAHWFPTAKLKSNGKQLAWHICQEEATRWQPRPVGYQHPEVNDG